jgi:hypothetical protein
LDKEGEELLITEETASAMLTEEDSNLATLVPSNCSKFKLALHMVLHTPVSNCMLDKERYCAHSGSSDLELMHPCRDGAGQAAHIPHRPIGHISDTSVCKLVVGWLKGMLLEWAQVLTHASGLSKSLWGHIKCSRTTAQLKGEQNINLSVHGKQPAAPQILTSPSTATPSSMPADTAPSMPTQDNAPGELPEHLHCSAPPLIPLCPMHNVQPEECTAAPSHVHRSQLPGPLEEAGGAWAIKHGTDTPELLEDPEGSESKLAAETLDAEATEPSTLKVTGTRKSEEASLGTTNSTLNSSRVLCTQHLPGHKSPKAGMCTLHLSKMPYTLKQPGHHLFQELMSIFTSLSFKWCAADKAVTLKSDTSKGNPKMIAAHADDCTVIVTFLCLADSFKATGLSWLHCMPGIEIKLNPEACITHFPQHAYIDATPCHYHLDKLKPLSILTDDMAADMLTTALHSAKVKHFTASLDCTQNEGECCRM